MKKSLALLSLWILAAGCTPANPPSASPAAASPAGSSTAAGAAVEDGLHFVQWEAYAAGDEGDDLLLPFSYTATGTALAARVTAVTLLTDVGRVTTRIAARNGGVGGTDYSMETLSVTPQGLHAGAYAFDAIEVATDRGTKRYTVGQWLLEIQARPLDQPFRLDQITIGDTDLSDIEAILTNTSAKKVSVLGIRAPLPERGVTFAQYSGAPGNLTDRLVIGPGEQQTVGYAPSATSQTPPFVFAKPLLRFQVDGSSQVLGFPLLNQVWAAEFASDDAVWAYIRALPRSASGTAE